MLRPILLAIAALLLCQPAWAQDKTASTQPVVEKPIPLKKGDRIVFLGDSITAGGVGKTGYIGLMNDYLKAKHKDLGLELIGAGVSGNKVPDLQKRVDKAVIAKKPTIVFIYIGINDVWHADSGNGTPKDKYEAGLKEVIGKIQAGGARVIVCTPSVIGEKPDGSNKHDASLDEYAAISRAVAKEMKTELCDLRKGFIATLKVENLKSKEAGILTGDRVHLNAAGNKLVAEMMLNQFGETLAKPAPAPAPEKSPKTGQAEPSKSPRLAVAAIGAVPVSPGIGQDRIDR